MKKTVFMRLGLLALVMVLGLAFAACKDNIGVNNWPTYGAPSNVSATGNANSTFIVVYTPAAGVPDSEHRAYIRIKGTNVIQEVEIKTQSSANGTITATGTSTYTTYSGSIEITVGARNALGAPSYGNWVAINP